MGFLATLVVARFVLELLGVPHQTTRYFSATVGLLFAGIYMAAVGPLRGCLEKFSQLLLPSLILSAWTQAWVIAATIIAAVFRLQRSHYADLRDYGDWGALARHILGHVIEIAVFFLIILLLMAIVHVLWRWPVAVAPGALLGMVVIMRFWTEAMRVEPWRAAAWSSTVLVLLGAVYVGGIGPRLGLTGARSLFVPSLVLGWTWRLWVYLATVVAALVPDFQTHFFDVTQGPAAPRLVRLLAFSVLEGFIAGLIAWGIAVWIARATRPRTA
jgi:hypothetical protein